MSVPAEKRHPERLRLVNFLQRLGVFPLSHGDVLGCPIFRQHPVFWFPPFEFLLRNILLSGMGLFIQIVDEGERSFGNQCGSNESLILCQQPIGFIRAGLAEMVKQRRVVSCNRCRNQRIVLGTECLLEISVDYSMARLMYSSSIVDPPFSAIPCSNVRCPAFDPSRTLIAPGRCPAK